MADLTAARPEARYGDPNIVFPSIYGPFGVIANTLIYGGALCGTDASGNMLSASASTCIQVVGTARKTYYNRTTDPSGGAAGAVLGEMVAGPQPFFINTDGGAITNANRWQEVFVSDNQTVSLTSTTSAGVNRLPAGYVIFVDNLGGPTNGLVWVQVGENNPYAAVKHLTANLTLAQIQAQTSGTAFTVVTLPTPFYVLGAEVVTTQTFAGGGVTSITTSLAALTADSAGALIATGANQITSGVVNGKAGSNAYQKRGGQAIQIVITEVGGTLATLTAGTLTVDIFGLPIS